MIHMAMIHMAMIHVASAADVGDELTTLLRDALAVGIKVLVFLVIMALSWFVASWLRRSLRRFLQRVGFDDVVGRGGLQRMLGPNSASDLAARGVAFAFLLFALQLAFGVFGHNPVSDLIGSVVAWLPRLFVAIVTVVVTAAIAGWVRNLVDATLGGLSYGRAVATAVQVLILTLGIMAALNHLGVATSVTLPVLFAVLFTVGGVIVVGVGGGLIRPMQHRWERLLNRAETETTLAAERLRAHRAPTVPRRNVRNSFGQPPYGGRARTDEKAPPDAPDGTAEPSDREPDGTAEPSDREPAGTAPIEPPPGTVL
jgi:Mechanosensitive ion channel, conserved TM helix